MLVSALVLALGAGNARAQAPTPDPAPVPPPYVPPPEPVQTDPSSSSVQQAPTDPAGEPKTKQSKKPRPGRASPSLRRVDPSFVLTVPGADAQRGLATLVSSQQLADGPRVRSRAALLVALGALAVLLGVGALLLPRSGLQLVVARTRNGLSSLGR